MFGSRQGNVEVSFGAIIIIIIDQKLRIIMLQLQSQMSGAGPGSEAEAAKYSKLCKDVRKQLIEEIMKKHR